MRRAFAILALLLVPHLAAARCETVPPEARPQNLGREQIGHTLDEIVERGFVTIAVYEDFAPWSWAEDGVARGIDVELGRIIAAAIGVEPRFDLVQAGETVDMDLLAYVTRGPIVDGRVSNIMMHVPLNSDFACRNDVAVLTGPYAAETVAIAYDRAAYPDRPPVPAYFRFDAVGVENDSLADFYLSSFSNGMLMPNIRRFPSPASAMAAMSAGEVKAVMGARAQLEWALRDGQAVHAPPLPGLAVGTWRIGIAVRENARDLGYAADDAIQAAASDGRLQAIFTAHGVTWTRAEP